MSVVVLCSATGAPGVSTLALGLTLNWPGDAVLVDADRDCGHAALAGYLHGIDPQGCGLVALTQVYREGGRMDAELLHRCLPLAGREAERHFLPGFTRPGTATMFRPLWGELGAALGVVSEAGYDVVVDAGRLGEGLPEALIAAADVVALVTRSTLPAVIGAKVHFDELREEVSLVSNADLGLVVVGPGRPYGATEIGTEFDAPVLAEIEFDPELAAVHSEGTPAGRRFAASGYARSVTAAATALRSRVQLRRFAIEGAS